MDEIWKDIEGYEGLYQVSNLGRIKSLQKWKRASCPDEYILKPSENNCGYYQVMLYRHTKKKKFLIHRIVAQAFVPNPDNLPHINHIDENKTNNCADNLEWCTPRYNNCYGTAKFRAMLTIGKPVEQRLVNGQLLAIYITPTIAEQITGISRKEISACIRGDICSAGGFIWKQSSHIYSTPHVAPPQFLCTLRDHECRSAL